MPFVEKFYENEEDGWGKIFIAITGDVMVGVSILLLVAILVLLQKSCYCNVHKNHAIERDECRVVPK
ncbi:hypothetical protein [Fibrobacter intestinalis]|uniref:hypothetical protein n=1 Tax=Fibrobacter TaxID=832 RepID=UPI00117BCA2D|nr:MULTISPECIES: hypothetical protein [Fibrobacter]